MRLPVVWSDECLRHDPDARCSSACRTPAVEVAARVERIREALEAAGARVVPAERHGDEALLAVHDAALVEYLRDAWAEWERSGLRDDPGQNRVVPYNFSRRGIGARREPVAIWARAGWYAYDTMTPIGPGTWEAARAAVDCALTAVDLVAAGEPAAYACVRPPGHHAGRDSFGGACYLNNAAVAAEALRARLGGPVAVVDIDAHHAQRHPGALLRPGRRRRRLRPRRSRRRLVPARPRLRRRDRQRSRSRREPEPAARPGRRRRRVARRGRRGGRPRRRRARTRRLARRRRRRRRPGEPAPRERGRLPRGGPDPRRARAADGARPGGRLRPRDDRAARARDAPRLRVGPRLRAGCSYALRRTSLVTAIHCCIVSPS